MKLVQTARATGFFKVVGGTARSQGATMILRPGQSTGGADNVHEQSDQWLYVVSGRGRATVDGRDVTLDAGALLLIEAGETHEISNTGTTPLMTISVYTPPVY
jgi:mannose-6-phosphate isomerase-like protein (cupin superfamily)